MVNLMSQKRYKRYVTIRATQYKKHSDLNLDIISLVIILY